MKRSFWPIVCLSLIIAVLYSRAFFLGQDDSIQKKSIETQSAASQGTPPDPVPSLTSTALVLPPKSEPLAMPAMTYPPFTMQDESGKWVGADNEIIESVLQGMGYKVQWLEMSFARALEETKSGKYPAMTAWVEGGGSEEYILFSDPISSIYSVLWQKKGDPFTWATYDDLKGRVIGASHYHYGAGFFEAAKAGKFELDMVAAKKPEVIHFRKLLQGKTDMFICELSLGLYLQKMHRPEFDNVVPFPTSVGPARPFSFAISRKYFEGREEQMQAFVAVFNKELAAFAKEGHRKEIFDKYHMSIHMDKDGMIISPVAQ
ncbi:MAG: transporter substrate-binding domain-containing protein [Thermodesulfobacteriota bacterium]